MKCRLTGFTNDCVHVSKTERKRRQRDLLHVIPVLTVSVLRSNAAQPADQNWMYLARATVARFVPVGIKQT